jgi:hypothetical protein
MSSLLAIPVQILFRFTSKEKALCQASEFRDRYLRFIEQAGDTAGQPRTVPKMPGVDEDMRSWSLYQLLEHNTIVNRAITNLICDLAAGVGTADMARFDPKKDVMPSAEAGPEQVELFTESIQQHLSRVTPLSDLRNTARFPHPMFGNFTAHQWTCMFSLHLRVHFRQAALLAGNGKGGS